MSGRRINFSPDAFTEYLEWNKTDAKAFKKINDLLKECSKTPFEGTGQPEALKYDLKKFWSRRINHGDRLIYQATEDEVIVVSCKGHYGDK